MYHFHHHHGTLRGLPRFTATSDIWRIHLLRVASLPCIVCHFWHSILGVYWRMQCRGGMAQGQGSQAQARDASAWRNRLIFPAVFMIFPTLFYVKNFPAVFMIFPSGMFINFPTHIFFKNIYAFGETNKLGQSQWAENRA